ncbi:galactose mutarotase [Albimonas sp. CAU 1670]|uniref:aldose epimerase family protein n=1 Tax=Albimonas sp. CAU 1670 TaxID=3032599 RepID=UPI0023DCE829|nr:aldose epimerase family protein [Albimonas sp. CAU 1670]MDF2232762.1 galactose mutarotase [Albimonas sp. CAU 1670]
MTLEIRDLARHEGEPIREATLDSGLARVRLLSWGCALRDWRAPVGGGWRACTLGLARVEDYPAHSPAYGAICGRVANRIRGARFELEGREVRLTPNEGANLLHGGRGLARRNWRMEAAGEALRLSWDSPDGEDGFPGAVAFTVDVRLDGARLIYEMRGVPDRPTPINLAQHAYWNLDGGGEVLDHRLRLDADRWAEVDAGQIPTGRLIPVGEGRPDFREPRTLRDADGRGIAVDHAYALSPGRDPARPAAELTSGAGDLRLRLWTDQPSVQVYDAPGLSLAVPGLDGTPAGPFAGLCLEAQNFPDAPNRPEFPSPLATPERPYVQRLEIEIREIPAAERAPRT